MLAPVVVAVLAVLGGCGWWSGDDGRVEVPDLVGIRAEDALARVCGLGLVPGEAELTPEQESQLSTGWTAFEPKPVDGEPIAQTYPPAGTVVARGSMIVLSLRNPVSKELYGYGAWKGCR